MNLSEREVKVLNCIREGVEYVKIMPRVGLKKGTLWKTVTDLLEKQAISRIGKGRYIVNDDIKANGHPIQLAPIIPEIFSSKPPSDIETVATDLFDKIGKLAPLLLLHKDIFHDIERSMMDLVERISEIKPLLLTPEEMKNYQELKAMELTAKQIAESKLKQK